jgi:4-amino-4-deoxy-L-arabinose transferase-like glycosyltransferase
LFLREMRSLARLGDLLLMELLRVESSQALTAAATPGADDLTRLAAEVGDHLAAAVARHADARLQSLLRRRADLVLVTFLIRGSTARALGRGLLRVVCVAHLPGTLPATSATNLYGSYMRTRGPSTKPVRVRAGPTWISVRGVRPPTIPLRWVTLALITTLAAALRLVDLGAVRLDPFYDAAVRSMGVSWHNFFFGAYEPGGSVSIDKPPVDLWLQVASVKLFGWGSASLKLPEALAGTLSVPLLYGAVKRPFGTIAGLVAALALAVLPIEVITARSDTMDAVMMLLLVLALLTVVRACETGKTAWLLAGAAMLGLAFNVKLLESVVALPGLFVLAWLGLPRMSEDSRGADFARRLAKLTAAAAVYVVVALLWLSATLLFPAHERPYAIGSTNGSAWNAAFVFNGTERLSGKTAEVGQTAPVVPRGRGGGEVASTGTPITPPSPTRLLARSGQLPAKWLGWEALAALLLGVAVVISVLRRKAGRVQRATAIGVLVWLLTGLVLFSAMTRLHPRYVESFTPAIAAMFGIGVGLLASLHNRARLLALPLTALLAVPLIASVEAVRAKTSDAGNVGALNQTEQHALSAYLLAHRGRARYELAAGSSTSVASLIVQDRRPVLMLTTYNGIPFTTVPQLKALIARGEVRYAFLDSVCTPGSSKTTAGCAPAALWIRAHGSDVSRQAGLRGGVLWRLPQSATVARPGAAGVRRTDRAKR